MDATSAASPAREAEEQAPPRRLGLSPLDKMATSALFRGDPNALLEMVRACAESLANPESRERDAARVRLLSREIGIVKAQVDLLMTDIGVRMQAGDERGALLADKLAVSATRRLQILCAEHRACGLAERQPNVVAIGHADHVRIEPAE
jgi:hypothetical protein